MVLCKCVCCLELTIGFLNVNGLHSNATSIKDTIMNNGLDVIGLSETLHRDSYDQCLSDVMPPHFNLVHTPRVSAHGGGMILLYDCRKFNSCSLLNIPTVTFYNISVKLLHGTQLYNVISIYRKPGYTGLAFREEFNTVLKTMKKRKAKILQRLSAVI